MSTSFDSLLPRRYLRENESVGPDPTSERAGKHHLPAAEEGVRERLDAVDLELDEAELSVKLLSKVSQA